MSQEFIDQKTLEIAHAIFRVAAHVQQPRLKSALEDAAIDMYAGGVTAPLERLIHLGEVVGEIRTVNAAVLFRELQNLNTAMRQIQDNKSSVDSDIQRIFSKPPMVIPTEPSRENNQNNEPFVERGNSQDRQALLVDKIRQIGNAAMRDLVTAFPGVSERTLRYDLQGLCEKGMLERIGNGGPGMFYRVNSGV